MNDSFLDSSSSIIPQDSSLLLFKYPLLQILVYVLFIIIAFPTYVYFIILSNPDKSLQLLFFQDNSSYTIISILYFFGVTAIPSEIAMWQFHFNHWTLDISKAVVSDTKPNYYIFAIKLPNAKKADSFIFMFTHYFLIFIFLSITSYFQVQELIDFPVLIILFLYWFMPQQLRQHYSFLYNKLPIFEKRNIIKMYPRRKSKINDYVDQDYNT